MLLLVQRRHIWILTEAIKSDAINILEKLDGCGFIGIELFQSLVLMSGEDISGNMAELMAKLAILFVTLVVVRVEGDYGQNG